MNTAARQRHRTAVRYRIRLFLSLELEVDACTEYLVGAAVGVATGQRGVEVVLRLVALVVLVGGPEVAHVQFHLLAQVDSTTKADAVAVTRE